MSIGPFNTGLLRRRQYHIAHRRGKGHAAGRGGCLGVDAAHRPAVDLAERHRRCPIDLHPRRKDDGKNCFERRQF